MEKLRRENESLKTELAMEFRQFRKPVDSSSADRIAQVRHECDIEPPGTGTRVGTYYSGHQRTPTNASLSHFLGSICLKIQFVFLARFARRLLRTPTALHVFTPHQLQEQAEHFVVSIESEKRAIDTVAEQTGLMKHKILHQRKMMGGVNAAKENEYMVQKQVQTSYVTLSQLRSGQSTGEEYLVHNAFCEPLK